MSTWHQFLGMVPGTSFWEWYLAPVPVTGFRRAYLASAPGTSLRSGYRSRMSLTFCKVDGTIHTVNVGNFHRNYLLVESSSSRTSLSVDWHHLLIPVEIAHSNVRRCVSWGSSLKHQVGSSTEFYCCSICNS
jgi:hypothetical protein